MYALRDGANRGQVPPDSHDVNPCNLTISLKMRDAGENEEEHWIHEMIETLFFFGFSLRWTFELHMQSRIDFCKLSCNII